MNMKKIILLSIFIASVSVAYCQYWMVSLGGGYSMPGLQNSGSLLTFQPGSGFTGSDPANASIIPLVNYNTSASDSTNRYRSNLYAGYSQGGHFDFSVAYMINPYFGVQIAGAYLWGKTVTGSQTFDDPFNATTGTGLLGNNANIITTTHSNGLSINPSVYLRAAKPTAKLAPYARAGIALPVAGAIYHNLAISSPNGSSNLFGAPTTADIGVKTTAELSVGFQGALGLSYTPIPLISVWAELQGQYLLVKAKEALLTQYTLNIQGKLINGQETQNMLGSNNLYGKPLSTYSQIISFVDQLSPSSNTTYFGKSRGGNGTQSNEVNENSAQQELRPTANLAAFGIAVGITFNMSKKIFQDPFGKKAAAAAASK
jgi:hypothetical protein